MKTATLLALASLALASCIGTDFLDDAVAPELRLAPLPDTIALGDTVDLRAAYFDNLGREAAATVVYVSADPGVFRVTDAGRGVGVAAGQTTLSAEVTADGETLRETATVTVADAPVVLPAIREASGAIATTSSYVLAGDFTITEEDGGLTIAFGDDYVADRGLPGLYVYLTNNARTNVGALELARVETFAGAHAYRAEGLTLDDYSHLLYFCKPFSVKVGDGEILEP